MSRVRGGLGVAVALATFAAFSMPALAWSVPTLPDAAVTGVSNRAVCTPGPAGTARCHAHVVTGADGVAPRASSSYPSGAYGTAQLRGAYGLTTDSSATVAIVDAFQNPNVASDLAAYRSAAGLPACALGTCFRVLNQTGGTSLSGVPGNTGWGQEIDLDVEMVSAVCPGCKIVLVEANSNYYSDLATAVNTAKGISGVVAVSNSYGGGEWSGETGYNSVYSPGVSNQVITVSSGDSGYGVEFPAAAPGVVAVGGTSLYMSGNTRTSETAWSGAGSGCSAVEPKPSNQADSGCSRRTVADVSAVADPNTGVAVYDSYGSSGGANWYQFGGTSVAAPIIAAVYALGGGGSASNTYTARSYTVNMNDVTSGSNGRCTVGGNPHKVSSGGAAYLCTAVTGYDGPTGLGTPNGIGAF